MTSNNWCKYFSKLIADRILKNFSLLLVLEMPAPKTCGVRRASSPVQFLYNQLILPLLGTSSAGVCSYTQSGCVCRSLPCCPQNLSSEPVWDPKDSSGWEQIHVELQHISLLSVQKQWRKPARGSGTPEKDISFLHCSDARPLAKQLLPLLQLWGLCQVKCESEGWLEQEGF